MRRGIAGFVVVAVIAGMTGLPGARAEVVERPPNDDMAAARPFTQLPYEATVDMTYATEELPNEPQNCGLAEKSVWYTWTPAADTGVVASARALFESLYGDDRLVTVLQKSSAGAYTFVTCGLPSVFTGKAGTTYAFRVSTPYEDRGEVEFSVVRAGAVSGTVLNTAGSPLTDICATLFERSGSGDYFGVVSARTDAEGGFTLAPARAGTYYLRVGCSAPGDPWVEQWWNGKTGADADPIQVVNGSVTTGVVVTLKRIRSITGRVLDEDGKPLSSLCVDALDERGAYVTPAARADGNGFYRLEVATPGRYKVRFACGDDRSAVSEWYPDAPDAASASWVSVGEEETSGVDGTLIRQVAPANDAFAAARPIQSLPFSDRRYNLWATEEANEPAPCGSARGSVWYRFTAPATGALAAAVFAETDYAAAVAVYRGATLASLEPLGCAHGPREGGTAVEFDAVAGETYYVQSSASGSGYGWIRTVLSPFGGDASDSISLAAACAPSCPYAKHDAEQLAGRQDEACATAPVAPQGSWRDVTLTVPHAVGGRTPTHLLVSLKPDGDHDGFICGDDAPARAANRWAIVPTSGCVAACAETGLRPVAPGEQYTVRVYAFAPAGTSALRTGYLLR